MLRIPLALAALFTCAVGPAGAAEPELLHLEGVKAEVRAPQGTWTREVKNLAAGQWRAAFRSAKAQLEVRTFPVQSVEDAIKALWQAADTTSRQVKGDGFGLPAPRVLRLEGRPAAESDWWVQVGTTRWEGRMRLLRAAPDLWALAWGLAAPDASVEEQRGAADFAGTLAPSEPAFHEPTLSDGDPEEVLVKPPGEPSVVRRHTVAVLTLVEAGAGVRFPRAVRAKVLAALAREAREGGATAREGLRAAADAFAESAGLAPEARDAARAALGKKLVDGLHERSKAGNAPAHELVLTLARGREVAVGTAESGLTRFEAEAWLDGCAFQTELAADQPFEPTPEQRQVQRATLASRWAGWSLEDRAHVRTAARKAVDLVRAWAQADTNDRFIVRATAVSLLLPDSPPGSEPPVMGDLKALRAWLDAAVRDPNALFVKACALEPLHHRAKFSALFAKPLR